MKAVVDRTLRAVSPEAVVEEIDISSDPDLESRYGAEIPVLMVNGKKAAKYRVTESELTKLLSARREAG